MVHMYYVAKIGPQICPMCRVRRDEAAFSDINIYIIDTYGTNQKTTLMMLKRVSSRHSQAGLSLVAQVATSRISVFPILCSKRSIYRSEASSLARRSPRSSKIRLPRKAKIQTD